MFLKHIERKMKATIGIETLKLIITSSCKMQPVDLAQQGTVKSNDLLLALK